MINTFGSIKEVFSASFDEINSIHGISDSVSNSIFEWYSNDENKKLIKNLENIGLKISEKLQSNSGNLNGKTFRKELNHGCSKKFFISIGVKLI